MAVRPLLMAFPTNLSASSKLGLLSTSKPPRSTAKIKPSNFNYPMVKWFPIFDGFVLVIIKTFFAEIQRRVS